jgi:hypothetical protein
MFLIEVTAKDQCLATLASSSIASNDELNIHILSE